MSENYRALIAMLVLALPTLLWLRGPLTWRVLEPKDYKARAVAWLVLTVALFVSPDFWLFILVAAMVLAIASHADSDALGLYFFVLFVAPPFEAVIPGFGGINQFIGIDYLRLLGFVLLLPMAFRAAADPTAAAPFKLPADKYVVGYVALLLVLQFPLASFTHELRSALSLLVDVCLPYYVCSRRLSDPRRLRDALGSFVAACSVMAVIAVFETLKGWLLYSSLPHFLNVRWGYGAYMSREGSLRATVSAGHSIVLGYLLAAGLGMACALKAWFPSTRSWAAVVVLLAAGVMVTFSRGPWVGAAAVALVAISIGPGAAGRVSVAAIAALAALPLLMLTGNAAKILALLPFVGTSEATTVVYRQQLVEVSWNVLMMNPFFGSPYYMADPTMQQLRQGEGIIDMVNSYLGVALASGFVGLALFAGAFMSNLVGLANRLRRHHDKRSDDFAVGRALLATLAGIVLIIGTTSSINAIPVVYWCVVGMCAAYLRSSLVPPSVVAEPSRTRPAFRHART